MRRARGGRPGPSRPLSHAAPSSASRPANAAAQLRELVAKATAKAGNQEARANALRSLTALIASEPGAAAALPGLSELWPRLLALLSEPSPVIRAQAAAAVGRLGAIAATAAAAIPGGLSRSVLFDWSLLLLGSGQVNEASQFWALAALREGLVALPDEAIKPWAAALFDACERLLDSEVTSPSLLKPLLDILTQAARHTTALKARVRVFIDILLGWALDPEAPAGTRAAVANTLASFKAGWPPQPSFTQQLAAKLLADMRAHVAADSSSTPSLPGLSRFLGFSCCIAAVCRACAAGLHGIFPGFGELLTQTVACLLDGHDHYQGLLASQGSSDGMHDQLCLHVDTLLTVAATVPLLQDQPPTAGSPGGSQIQIADVYPGVLGLVLAMLRAPAAVSAGLAASLKLHLRTLQFVDRQKGSVPQSALDTLLAASSSFACLRTAESAAIVQLVAKTYVALLLGSDLATSEHATAHILKALEQWRELVGSETAESGRQERRLLAGFHLRVLQVVLESDGEETRNRSSQVYSELWRCCGPEGCLAGDVRLHTQALEILKAAAKGRALDLPCLCSLAVSSLAAEVRCCALDWLAQTSLLPSGKTDQGALKEGLWHAIALGAESGSSVVRLSAAKAMALLAGSPAPGVDTGALVFASTSGLADVSPAAREAWREALLTAAGRLPMGSAAVAGWKLAPWVRGLGLNPQERAFKAGQLAAFLCHLTGAKASWEASLPLNTNLLRMFSSCPLLGEKPPSLTARDFRSEGMLAWWAVQEVARHLVLLRLRSPWGGPAQTLAGLEAGIRRWLAPEPGQHPEAARQLLEFLGALERGIHAAAEGCLDRADPPPPAIAFFVSNCKVCSEWFARMRPLLIELAAKTGHHSCVLANTAAALVELRKQLHSMVAAAKAAQESQGGAAEVVQGKPKKEGSLQEQQPKLLLRRAEEEKVIDSALNRMRSMLPVQRLLNDLASAMQHAAAAAIALGEDDVIAGLHRHCLRAFASAKELLSSEGAQACSISSMLAWMPAARQHAAGSLEAALSSYMALLEAEGSARLSDEAQAFAESEVTKLFTATSDWAGLEAFLGRNEKLKPTADGKSRLSKTAFDPQRGLTNCALAAMSYERRDFDTARGLMELSSWAPLQPRRPAVESTDRLATVSDAGVFRALLATQRHASDNPSRWQEEVRKAVDDGQSAALTHCKIVLEEGAQEYQRPFSQLQMLQALQQHADGLPSRLMTVASADDSDDPTAAYAELLQLRQGVVGWSEPRIMTTTIAWCLRLAEVIDPSGATHAWLAAAAAAAGNPDHAERILAAAQALPGDAIDPHARRSMEFVSLRLSSTRGKRPLPWAVDLAGLVKAGPSPAALPVCLQLAECTAADTSPPPEMPDMELGRWAAAAAGLDESSCLALLVLATQLAPASAVSWAGLANWLHDRLDSLQGGGEELRSLAVAASCKRLENARPTPVAIAAAPELLRILKLVESSGSEQDQSLLTLLPPDIWQPVVPQLLSYLASHTEHMRKLAAELLQRLEETTPSAVLFPALAERRAPSPSPEHAGAVRELVEQCRQRNPAQLAQLESVVSVLARVTVLPNEEWHTILTGLQGDVAKRVATVRKEAIRLDARHALAVEERARLLRESFVTIMAPARVALQRRLSEWAGQQRTSPNEAWFEKHYLGKLQGLADSLQSPSRELLGEPGKLVQQVKGLAKAIAASLSDKSMKLSAIAPELAGLRDTAVPMPGMSSPALSHPGDEVTIAAFGDEVELLHTRTRPKKVTLVASDGHRHVFLLKGREDLRLDARLIQFLQLASGLLESDPKTARLGLAVRKFAVTPLTHRVGLVEWVPHTTPIFQVYSDWQAAAAKRLPTAASSEPSEGGKEGGGIKPKQRQVQPGRRRTPVEAFYAKLLPALQAAGLDRLASRKQWPAAVLKQVMAALAREVPRNVLERQIWGGSASSADWLRRQQAHSRSTAVMSVVGYLLGLGDRHLGNILLDRHSAEVVHIDFNIVFERGRKLPVPELVPFRLTQILQGALGVCGVEGSFRSSCTASLACLRRNAKAVSLLISAILHDNLVDWAPAHADAAADQAMELGVRLNLFCSRLDEIEPRLTALAATLEEAAAQHGVALADFFKALQPAVETARVAHEARLEASTAQEEIAKASESLQQQWQIAQTAAAERSQAVAEYERARGAAEAATQELRDICDGFAAVWAKLRGPSLAELESPLDCWVSGQSRAPLGLIESNVSRGGSVLGDLKHGQLPPALLEDCAAVDARVQGLLQARDAALYACVAAVKELAEAGRALLDESYWQSSHHAQWLTALLASTTAANEAEFSAAARLIPAGAHAVQLQETWEALGRAQACQKALQNEAQRSKTPAAILRADANAMELEVGQLLVQDDGPLRSALAGIAARLVADLEALKKDEAAADQEGAGFEGALEATLKLTIESGALLNAPHPAIARVLGAAAEAARPLKAGIACAAAISTVARMGEGAFLPELAGFCSTTVQAENLELFSEFGRFADEAAALASEAEGLMDSQRNEESSTPLGVRKTGQEAVLQQRAQALVVAFDATVSGATSCKSGVPGVLASVQGLHGLLAKLKAPLSSLMQGGALESCLNSFSFDFLSIRLLSDLVGGVHATDGGSELVLERMEAQLRQALHSLLASSLQPSLAHSLRLLQSACAGSKHGVEDEVAAERLEGILVRYVAARAELQVVELHEKRREVAAAVESRRQGACRRRAACEWLVPEIHAAAKACQRSQLDAFCSQGLLGAQLRSRADLVRELHVAVKSTQVAGEDLTAYLANNLPAVEQRLLTAVQERRPSVLPGLQERLALRREWFFRSEEQAVSLQQLGQELLKLEASRDAKTWSGGVVAPAAFEGYATLLETQRRSFLAMHASDGVVAAARAESQRLHTAAAAATSHISACEARAGAAGAHFLTLAPALVNASTNLPPTAEASATLLGAAAPSFEEAVTALEELCRASWVEYSREVADGAGDLQRQASGLLSRLKQAASGLPGLAKALRGVPLPAPEELQAGRVESRQLAAIAAAILDAAMPVLETSFPEPNLNISEEAGRAAEVGVQLAALRASASARAAAIQKEHGLPEELAAGNQVEEAGSHTCVARDAARLAARNAFAVAASKRFQAKLEGVSEAGQGEARRKVQLSEAAQVEKLLQQAVNPDSLAQMYEGWMPWI